MFCITQLQVVIFLDHPNMCLISKPKAIIVCVRAHARVCVCVQLGLGQLSAFFKHHCGDMNVIASKCSVHTEFSRYFV